MVIRFHTFAFDQNKKELLRSGIRVRLSASQIRLLTLFLERPGDLITREEIEGRLWTDSRTINVTTGINTAINQLRANLGDNPAVPIFIETVIGLGYRFIPPVHHSGSPQNPPAHEEGPLASKELVELGDDGTRQADDPKADASRTPRELTALDPPALERSPINQTMPVVGADVKRPAGLSSLKRTWAIWMIVCSLMLATAMTFLVRRNILARSPAKAGAPLQFSQITFASDTNKKLAEAVSPDGQSVAYADNDGISMHWFNNSPERLLAPMPSFQVNHISWFPSGSQLLVSGVDQRTQRSQVWMVPTWGAYSKSICQDCALATMSLNGESMVFTRAENTEVWIAGADGQDPRRLFAVDQRTISFLLWSRDNERVLIASRKAGSGVPKTQTTAPVSGASGGQEQGSLESISADSGKLLAHVDSVSMDSAVLLPDGSLDFLPRDPDPQSSRRARIMTVQTDASTGLPRGTPTVLRELQGDHAEGLSVSQDGKRFGVIVDRGTAQAFTAALHYPGPVLEDVQRASDSRFDAYPHSWTPDGAVLFETPSESNRLAIFKQFSNAPKATLVAQLSSDAAMAEITPDGRWVLLLQFDGAPLRPVALYRVPAAGGQPERVPTTGQIEEFHCPATPGKECVLREAIGHDELVYYALDPIQGMGKVLARTTWEPNRLGDWGISRDGSAVAVANHDILHPSIHVIQLGGSSGQDQNIPFEGYGTVLGANWASDNQSLFVQCRTEKGSQLIYRDFAGHKTLLAESPLLLWAVPSADGRRIAFPGRTISRNVWSAEMRDQP